MSSGGLTTRDTETTELTKEINQLTEFIIGCAIKVQPALGPGLLESAYGIGLRRELSVNDVAFERQKVAPVAYKAVKLNCGYRADLILDGRVLVEIESGNQLAAIHDAKLLSYLKLSGLKIGLLINFSVPVLPQGIRRKVLAPPEQISDRSALSVNSLGRLI